MSGTLNFYLSLKLILKDSVVDLDLDPDSVGSLDPDPGGQKLPRKIERKK
jgi:hypothetical protein